MGWKNIVSGAGLTLVAVTLASAQDPKDGRAAAQAATFAAPSAAAGPRPVSQQSRPWPCPHLHCGESFWSRSALRHHVFVAHERPFVCPFPDCHQAFSTSNLRAKHAREEHPPGSFPPLNPNRKGTAGQLPGTAGHPGRTDPSSKRLQSQLRPPAAPGPSLENQPAAADDCLGYAWLMDAMGTLRRRLRPEGSFPSSVQLCGALATWICSGPEAAEPLLLPEGLGELVDPLGSASAVGGAAPAAGSGPNFGPALGVVLCDLDEVLIQAARAGARHRCLGLITWPLANPSLADRVGAVLCLAEAGQGLPRLRYLDPNDQAPSIRVSAAGVDTLPPFVTVRILPL